MEKHGTKSLVLENGLLSSPGTKEAKEEHTSPEMRKTSPAPCTACSSASHAAKNKNL